MSPNIRKRIPYDETNYRNYQKTIDISALSFHKMLTVAKRLDAIAEWGSVVALTYIAAQRSFADYNDMADAKALLESITRSFGLIYGEARHVRINTVSQSPTATTAGEGIEGMEQLRIYADKMSPLGNADADDCADYCVALFSDLMRKVTMQNLFHDGGFSRVGISREALEQFFS
jgi:enoyl-[acyl-carrier protein] reductase I